MHRAAVLLSCTAVLAGAQSYYEEAAPRHNAAEVLRLAIRALEGVQAIRYEVRLLPPTQSLAADANFKKMSGTSMVTGTPGFPIRYRARFQSADDRDVELAVSDGEKVRFSVAGKLEEYRTRTIEDRASVGALPTLQLFDVARYRALLESGRALYAGQDDVEGDLCYVLVSPALFKEEVGSDTFYYWISAKTGLPRSRQTYRILHGKVMLTHRWVLSNIELNPELAEDWWKYRPTVRDSTPGLAEQAAEDWSREYAALRGKALPGGLEVRDLDYRPHRLAELVKGKPALITLWAPWCGPCVEEMPLFQKALEKYKDRLQVIALGVEDSRLAFQNYAAKHPELGFLWVTDPKLGESGTAVGRFFSGLGIPRNAYVDGEGRVTDYDAGGYGGSEKRKAEFWSKLETLISGSSKRQ